jgi:Flp pilus assembly protein TadB
MDIVTAVFAGIALATLAGRTAARRARHSSALAAAGLGRAGTPSSRPSFHRSARFETGIARLGRAVRARAGDGMARLLEESGSAWTPDYLQGLRTVSAAALAASSLPLGLAALPLAPLLFAAGYHLPVMLLKRRRRRCRDMIASELPEIVDLMAVLCYAGESLLLAFGHAVSACGNTVSRAEMERVLERVHVGESTVEALRVAADHPCREMRPFSRTLIRAEEFGAPVAETLEDLAVELRNTRREKDRVRAARVSVLILLPLVFLILPSFLLLTVGGMILGYTL